MCAGLYPGGSTSSPTQLSLTHLTYEETEAQSEGPTVPGQARDPEEIHPASGTAPFPSSAQEPSWRSGSDVEQEGRLRLGMLSSNLVSLYWDIHCQHQVQSQVGKLKTGREGAGARCRPRGMTAGMALRLGETSRLENQVNTGPNPDLTTNSV